MRWIVLATLLVVATPLIAQPEQPEALAGRWKSIGGQRSTFTLYLTDDGSYRGNVRSPRSRKTYRATLQRLPNKNRWELNLERLVDGHVGASGRLEGEDYVPTHWEEDSQVNLRRRSGHLVSSFKRWKIRVPDDVPSELLAARIEPDSTDDADEAEDPDEVIEPEPKLPVVKVLITGFDRFPRPKNHPRWIGDGRAESEREPKINPAGWVVREFQLSDLGEEFRQGVTVEIYKCLDVPVTYVEGARVIKEKIAEVQPDVVISFGVGADSGADADVETTCENLMDDCDLFMDDEGPFQLPADWPPKEPRSEWSDEDREWLVRYPDNAGVSYNGKVIDPEGPGRLTSLLPVDQIVKRVKSESLRSIDGGWGPGRYICNNVMYEVIKTQKARQRLGGFIHLNSWSESRRPKYITVLKCAVEESVKAWIAQQAAEALAGLPAEEPVVRVTDAQPLRGTP